MQMATAKIPRPPYHSWDSEYSEVNRTGVRHISKAQWPALVYLNLSNFQFNDEIRDKKYILNLVKSNFRKLAVLKISNSGCMLGG
jgi:hypothetical protein